MNRIVGVDLGTTHSLVAVVESGIPMVLADERGSRLLPSVVFYDAQGAATVGYEAARVRAVHPDRTIFSVKRFMGRRFKELAPEERAPGYPVAAGAEGAVLLQPGGLERTPEQVSAEILRALKHTAERSLGESVQRAVITVPAYFNDAQRQATKRAGELAGWTVERVLNEPTAAALAFGLGRLKEHGRIAVYDLGGGTFDLSILEMREGVFQVLATNGNTRLGGDDIDRRVVAALAEKVRAAGGPGAEDPVLQARLREAAEDAKIRLSVVEEIEVALPFLAPGFSFACPFTRGELEDLARDVVQRTRAHCERALADARLRADELDQVILVGGQTRMPLVRRLVSEWFGCVEFDALRGEVSAGDGRHRAAGPGLNTSQNPDEAVALGAAIQGEILSGGLQHVLLLDVTPLSLGLETFGGLMNVLIPRNSTIPTKAGEVFTNAVDGQTEMLVHVLQGERERAADNWSLGRFAVGLPAAPRGTSRVGVQFEIDANGILHVLARDLLTGAQSVVELKSAVDVDEDRVVEMVEESVAHAFEDLRVRRWVELKLRAVESLQATREALAEFDAELEPGYAEQVRAAAAAVQQTLEAEDPATRTGDVEQLRSRMLELDAVTQTLADRLVQSAVESQVRRPRP